MNNNAVVFFVVNIVIGNLQSSCAMKILQPKVIVFQKNYENLQTVTNQLFKMLNVNKTFWKTNKTKLLLTIHNRSQKIVKNNLKIYKGIKIASKVDFDHKTLNLFFNLTEVIEAVLKFMIEQRFESGNEYDGEAFSQDTSYQALNFVTDFLRIINDLSLDIVKPVNYNELKELNETMAKILRRRKTYNLNVWRSSNPSDDEFLFNQTRRIYKGKPTKYKKFPFLASIHVMREFMCSGSIISKDLVITAASCLQVAYKSRYDRGNSNFLAIRIGSDYSLRFGELVPIIDVYFHPAYDPAFLRNNLAIAQFKAHRSRRRNLKIMKIEYKPTVDLDDDAKVTMLGWGNKDVEVSGKFEPLSITELNMYNLNRCMDTYTRDFVDDKNFCAGFTNKGSGACSRDVGGPGILNKALVGVVSFGPPECGSPGAPTVFTRTEFYIGWIDSIVNKKPLSTMESTIYPMGRSGLVSKSKKIGRMGPELVDKQETLTSSSKPQLLKENQLTTNLHNQYRGMEKEKKNIWTTISTTSKPHNYSPLSQPIQQSVTEYSIHPKLYQIKPIDTPVAITEKTVIIKMPPVENKNTMEKIQMMKNVLQPELISRLKKRYLVIEDEEKKTRSPYYKSTLIGEFMEVPVSRQLLPDLPAINETTTSDEESDNYETKEVLVEIASDSEDGLSIDVDAITNISKPQILRNIRKINRYYTREDMIFPTNTLPTKEKEKERNQLHAQILVTKEPLDWVKEPDFEEGELTPRSFRSGYGYSRSYFSSPNIGSYIQRAKNSMEFKTNNVDKKLINVVEESGINDEPVVEYVYEFETDDNSYEEEASTRSLLEYLNFT